MAFAIFPTSSAFAKGNARRPPATLRNQTRGGALRRGERDLRASAAGVESRPLQNDDSMWWTNLAERILEAPTDAQLGPSGFLRYRENKQGLKLGTYFWPAEKPRGLIFLIHGHGIHTEFAYLKMTRPGERPVYEGSWVQAFNEQGFSVCGLDNQSCGRSEGLGGYRVYFDSFDDIVNDSVEFLSEIKAGSEQKFSGLKTFIVGGSAGGCAAVHAAHSNPSLCDGVVLLAPMLSLEKVSKEGFNRYLKPLLSLATRLIPSLPIAATTKNDMFPDVQAYYDLDPACWHGKTRIRVASEFLKAADWVVREMDNMSFPFFCVHSQDDTMCDLDGSKALFEKCKSEDKELEIVKDMWHVLVHEPGSEDILNKVLTWVHERSK
ncbi:hypothetical protein BSKO_07184 [Bryopsis sp. KO-2023]|nr:hypothetical protein BSKO_07184 [Bryopsis sp. KO-2023]